MAESASLTDLLAAAGARRAHPLLTVWDLDDPRWPFGARARQVEQGKQQVFHWLLERVPTLYLVTGETDDMGKVPGALYTGVEHTWRITPSVSRTELESAALQYGSWALYARPEPVAPASLPDSFDTDPDSLVAALKRLDLGLLLQAWHDDVEWRLALADESLLRAPA
jgi:hypothetical protein